MPKTYLKIRKSKAEDAHVQADISNHRGQNIENEERRERLRRILESRKAKSANDQEKVQSAAATKDNINGTSNDASGYGRVFFIAHVVMVAIFGRLVMKTTADTSISKIRRRNFLIESVKLGWPCVSFAVRTEENVIGSLFGGLRECWFWFPLESV